MLASVCDANASGAARRRQRRVGQWLRHERLSVAMALAENNHHSAPRRPTMARARGEESEMHNAMDQMTPLPEAASTQYFAMDVDEVPAAGSRPDRLTEVRPQERVLRRTVEQNVEPVRVVPVLDAPVSQMVDQAAEVVRFFVSLPVVAEQVIEVPTIIPEDPIPQRALLRAPQLAEQLVEVPTTPSYGGGGKHELCFSSSTPPGQGGIQILAAATGAEAVVDVSVTTQLRSSRISSSTWRCLSFSSSTEWWCSCFTETGTQCKLCRSPSRFFRGSSWTGWDTRCCATTGAWV